MDEFRVNEVDEFPPLLDNDEPWTAAEKEVLRFFLDPRKYMELSKVLSERYGRAVLAGAFQGVNALPFNENVKDLFSTFFADFMSAGFLVGYVMGREDKNNELR